MGDFEIAGLVDTRGSGHVVTGSAAGATALATGTRTFFGAVGVGPDGTPRQTVLEAAKARGMATALTSSPASRGRLSWAALFCIQSTYFVQMSITPHFPGAGRLNSVGMRAPLVYTSTAAMSSRFSAKSISASENSK